MEEAIATLSCHLEVVGTCFHSGNILTIFNCFGRYMLFHWQSCLSSTRNSFSLGMPINSFIEVHWIFLEARSLSFRCGGGLNFEALLLAGQKVVSCRGFFPFLHLLLDFPTICRKARSMSPFGYSRFFSSLSIDRSCIHQTYSRLRGS